MKILVNGSTGTVGSLVVERLVARGAEVHAVTRHPLLASLPRGAHAVKITGIDIDAMREAVAGIDALFLLVPVLPDELARALAFLDVAREAGVPHVVYFSMKNSTTFRDVTHAASKHAAERMLAEHGIAATILRPNYFFQNDAKLRESILDRGVYPTPIGEIGVSMNDARDIADVAVLKLLENRRADVANVDLVEIAGPDVLKGSSVAALWSEVTGRAVSYQGDDLQAFETAAREGGSAWNAHDTMAMFRGFQQEGMVAEAGVAERLSAMLGRPLRTYRDFVRETFESWR